MAYNADSYDTFERDRQRALRLAHVLTGIPTDDGHEAHIRRTQEQKAKDRFAQQETAKNVHSSPPTGRRDKRTPSSPSLENRSSFGSQASTVSDQTDLKTKRTINSQREAEPPISFLDGDNIEESSPKNIWPILLLFDNNNKDFEGKVILDSGAEDNWISERTVKENGLPWESDEDDEDDEDAYEDVNGQIVKSCGIVRAQWIFRHQTIPVEFKIARSPRASWQVIFGYRHLIENNVITLHENKATRWVAPLIKRERKPTSGKSCVVQCFHSGVYQPLTVRLFSVQTQQIERNEEGSRTASSRIHEFLEWKKRMNEAGWHWDKEHNNFNRQIGDGGKVWCEDGWHVNFTVSEPPQAN
jgi:hypothetical protein